MKNLLFNSISVLSVLLILSCSYSNQNSAQTASGDTVAIASADTTPIESPDSTQAMAVKGDSVAALSTRVESTEPGTVNKHPGAVKNPGANQSETDSIKKAKTKGKKKE
ncbi:MAG: hypothetical protein IH596_04345 [Bacteroidales bacterium]|nr:hypothetical protein [Bacteroidales bacterium]